MTSLTITVKGTDIARVLHVAAERAPAVLARAVNQTAVATRKAMVPVLTAQTALPGKTIVRALKQTAATEATLTATIASAGGDISLKYFKPVETAPGVSAAPRGARQVYVHSFMKAGRFPNRIDKPNWHGQVFVRAGGTTRTGKARFTRVRSGEYIPTEMVTGNTASTFTAVSTTQLGSAVDKAVAALLGGK